jgi:hypothetical protein
MREHRVEEIPIPVVCQAPRWSWLARLMGKLRLLKTTTWEHRYLGMATTTIRVDDLREFIDRYRAALGDFYGWRIADLYVGRKYFAELMRIDAPGIGDWGADLSVDVPRMYAERTGLDQIQYHGVKVHLVPWFDGILALPSSRSPGTVDVRCPDLEPKPVEEPKRELYRRGWHNRGG